MITSLKRLISIAVTLSSFVVLPGVGLAAGQSLAWSSYNGTVTQTAHPQAYELISNESTDTVNSESTGTFQINNSQVLNKTTNSSPIDIVKPFDSASNAGKALTKDNRRIQSVDEVGDSKSFWVSNLVTNDYYSLNMTLLYSGTHVNVWVNDNQLTSDEAAQLGTEFDNKIYPLDTTTFGSAPNVDGTGKINILCYDIQDGFSGSGGYVAGYFSPMDLYNMPDSNDSEVFYIDTNPLMGTGPTKDVTQAYSTLAHEFQHMINFNQKVFVQGGTSMDTWMNEGLSMAAEQLYSGQVLQDRIDYYNSDPEIASGHSLLAWDSNGDTLANYSLSYLFMQYLKIQCGQGNQIFKDLINDPHSDYMAVQDMIQEYIDPKLTFGQFMTDFRAALVLKEPTGLYGFHGDPEFDSISTQTYSGSGAVSLTGGGAVVKALNSPSDFSVPADKGTDVTYTLLDSTQVTSQASTAPMSVSNQTPLTAPRVNSVSNISTAVTGKTEAGLQVYVMVGSTIIGKGQAGSTGSFSIPIQKQSAGTNLLIFAENASGHKSSIIKLTVMDRTPPAKPTVNLVSNASSAVTGKTEADARVYVMAGSKSIGTGKADSKGNFTVSIPKQKAGVNLQIYAVDAAGNKSSSVMMKVIGRTAPIEPTVNKVTPHSTEVAGKTEKATAVYLYRGRTYLGRTTASSNGSYKIKLAKQKNGTILTIYAKDQFGSQSKSRLVCVSG